MFRPLPVELALCQRYYWANPAGHTFSGYAATTGAAFGACPFPVTMRVVPTVTFPGAIVGDYVVGAGTSTIASNSVANVQTNFPASTQSVGVQFNMAAASLTAGQGVLMKAALANYIVADARL
jgi:hypothetical protein